MVGKVLSSLSCELVLNILHCCTSKSHCFLQVFVLSMLSVQSLLLFLQVSVVLVLGTLSFDKRCIETFWVCNQSLFFIKCKVRRHM